MHAVQVVYDIIYTFHMPLFFMMSGYIEYANHRADGEKSKLATVLKKDIISLYIPYIFLNYIYWFERFSACKLLGVNLDNPVRTSITELAELLYNGDGVSWFLLSILHIKLLFDILDRYVPDFVIFSIFSVLFWLRFLDLGITIEAFGWGVFYYTGYLVGKYNIDKIGGGQRTLISILCINVAAVGFTFYVNMGLDSIVKLLVGMSVFMLLMQYLHGMPKVNVINFCGRYSMVLYMMHVFSNYACYMILSKFITIPIVLLLLMVVLQISLAFIVFWIYSNISWLHWIKFIFYPYKFITERKD